MSQKHYTQLSYEERVLIEDWNKSTDADKKSLRQFAKHIKRDPSTISRELDRNGRPPTTQKTRINKPRIDNRHTRGRDNQKDKDRVARYYARRTIFLEQARIHYTAKTANDLALARVKHPGLKLEQPDNEELLQFVLTALDSRWSPEQISGRIKYENRNGDILPNISHEAIYRFIKKQKALDVLDLTSCLRHKGRKYRQQ